MNVYDYIRLLQSTDSLKELEEIVTVAADDDSLSNEEYERIYRTALACA